MEIWFSNISYISLEDAVHINKRSKVDKGDILMSMIGTIGDAVVVDFEPDFCIKNVALIKPNHNRTESYYIYQTIASKYYQQYIKENLDGGIQKFISLSALRMLSIPSHSSWTKSYSKSLSDIDELTTSIEKHNRQEEK